MMRISTPKTRFQLPKNSDLAHFPPLWKYLASGDSNWRNQQTLSPVCKANTRQLPLMLIFKCWANISVDNFIVKRKAWKHEKPIVLHWKCPKLHFTNCQSSGHWWLELRAGVIRWDARDAQIWEMEAENCYHGLLLSVAWGQCLVMGVSPERRHTLVITGERWRGEKT